MRVRMGRAAAALIVGGAIALAAAAGCHDLELAQLRCSVGRGCPSGYVCGSDDFCRRQVGDNGRVAGPPGSKKQGEACAGGDECETKNCVDGVCCDSACTDACRTCNHPDNRGACVAIARGEAPAHAGCDQQPAASCGANGLCDGMGGCQLYDDTTVCGEASCDGASNSFSPEARCDGHGACAAAASGGISCAPFACKANGKACADSCGAAAECVGANACVNGSCGLIGNGLPCHDAGQCQSGFCVDGVCCNAPCGEQCMACDTSAALGTCSPVVAGNPHGARAACAGAGTSCAGQCTAASATSCTYPAAETVCRSASCANGMSNAMQTAAATCDGHGACGAAVTTGCGVYLCGSGGLCATSCVGDFDCAAGFVCEGGACQAKGTTAAPCSSSGQCAAGLVCKDGVCCDGACTDACRSCNLPGQAGHCVVVASADDPDSCPADTHTCDAGGACKLKDGQSCGGGDCAAGACTTFYPDADGDTFGDAGKAKGFCGSAPAGWVPNGGDCCDTAGAGKDVHPGQAAWFTVAGPCGGFDYDCDGNATPQYPAGGACMDAISCTPGFTEAIACGASGNLQGCDSAMPPVCAAPAPTQQPCH